MKRIRNFFRPAQIIGLVVFLLAVVVVLHLRFNVGTISRVDGESMLPYYNNNDFVLVTLVKDPSEIQVGDVIIADVNGMNYVKRVQAIPGGTTVFDAEKSVPAVKMGDNEFYITGDNYKNSHDSRYFGPISGEQILYKCTNIRWSFWEAMIAVFVPGVLTIFVLSFIFLPPESHMMDIDIPTAVPVPEK